MNLPSLEVPLRIIEKTLHWGFAFFVTLVAFFASLILFAFLGLKLAGIPIGTVPGPGFRFDGGATAAIIYVFGTLGISLMASAYIGVITAPYRHREAASIVFPLFVFGFINILPMFSKAGGDFNLVFLAVTAFYSLLVWGYFYYKSTRKKAAPSTPASVFE